jgi:hypothetical protein
MRSVSDIGATAPISALTNAFSIGLDRRHKTDDFGPRIVAWREGTEQESAHLRPEVNRIRHVIGAI